MSRGRIVLAGLALACALTACDDGASAPPTARTPTPTPTTAATTPAGEAAQVLARAGLRSSYRATYAAHRTKPSRSATWTVARTRSALRIDVAERGVTATLIVSRHGAFACTKAKHRRTCFRVAKPGKQVPALFAKLAPQALFDSNLHALAEHAGAYDVKAAGNDTGPNGVTGTCFSVKAKRSAPKPRIATGTYCFTESGALTSMRFPTGSSARLTRLTMRAPAPTTFRPYSSPTPLPG